MACPLRRARTDLARTGPPNGAPPRRFQTLGPRFPLVPVSAFRRREGFKERALPVVMQEEAGPRSPGSVIASHTRGRHSPFPFWFAYRTTLSEWGCLRTIFLNGRCQEIRF